MDPFERFPPEHFSLNAPLKVRFQNLLFWNLKAVKWKPYLPKEMPRVRKPQNSKHWDSRTFYDFAE